MKFCGLCWKGEGNIRFHYCDALLGHDGPHRCHCGATLAKPVQLVSDIKLGPPKNKPKKVE